MSTDSNATPKPTPIATTIQPPLSNSDKFKYALSTIHPIDDFSKLLTYPCSRESLLFGITAGLSIGALRFLFSSSNGMRLIKSRLSTAGAGSASTAGAGEVKVNRLEGVGNAVNWAVGAWGVTTLGAWRNCESRRSAEFSRMDKIVHELKARRVGKPRPPPSELPPSPTLN